MNFFNTSLDNLVNNLKKSKYDFPCLKKHCKYIKNHTDLDLLTKNGTYTYEYVDCVEKFNDTELPKYEDFYAKVNGKNISEKEYTCTKGHNENISKLQKTSTTLDKICVSRRMSY